MLLGHHLSVLAYWSHSYSIGVTIALIVLTALGDQLQFEVRRGWYTNASAVAHVSAAFLLPPAAAMTIAGPGVVIRATRYPLPAAKAIFNVANMALAVGVAAHVASSFGGTINVRSTPGLGSTFCVRLPIRAPGDLSRALAA